jgi:hypothetical protein
MSIMAAMTAAAPILIPAAIGAAGGAGIGALTGDGFSDDDWWQGMLAGGLTGGIGGGMGMFSGNPLGGLLGGSAIPSSATTGLSSSPLPFSTPPAGGLDAFMASVNGAPVGGFSPATSGGSLGNFLGSTSGYGNNFLGAPSGSLFGGLSEIGRGNLGALNPSQDTLTKGLLGSMVMKNLGGSGKQQQPQRGVPLTKTQTTGLPPMRQGLPWQPSRGYQRRSLRR